jgi:hypothetical protein
MRDADLLFPQYFAWQIGWITQLAWDWISYWPLIGTIFFLLMFLFLCLVNAILSLICLMGKWNWLICLWSFVSCLVLLTSLGIASCFHKAHYIFAKPPCPYASLVCFLWLGRFILCHRRVGLLVAWFMWC